MPDADKLDAAFAFIFLAGLFLVSWACGLLHYGSGRLVTPAIIASGAMWLVASVTPLWLTEANLVAGLCNGVAAAFATYAGLCSTPGLRI